MRVAWMEKPTCEEVVKTVAALGKGGYTVLLMVGEACGADPAMLRDRLSGEGVVFAGVVCPAVLYGGRLCASGILALGLPSGGDPLVVLELDRRASGLPVALLRWAEQPPEEAKNRTLFVFVDGLAQGVSELLRDVSGLLGPSLTYIGGGAGYSDLVRRSCLFDREGVFSNAALLVPVQCRARCGVRHGWRRVGEPCIVTRSVSNRVIELNWENAFEAYREALRRFFGKDITPENFYSISKHHPLGILREGDEELVRDPIRVEQDGALFCVGAVPENATVSLMGGTPEALIAAAGAAAESVLTEPVPDGAVMWVADCVSRQSFLGERFGEEIGTMGAAAQKAGIRTPLFGFLSFGEVAGTMRGWVDFYNKTTVAALLYE